MIDQIIDYNRSFVEEKGYEKPTGRQDVENFEDIKIKIVNNFEGVKK